MTQPSGWRSRTQISVDGRTYQSVEEMPPAVRQRYEQAMRQFDRDGNGIPDVLEGAPPDPNVISSVTTHEHIIVNGREYDSWEKVPPGLRALAGPGSQRMASGGVHFSGGAVVVLLVIAGLLGAAIMWALVT